MSYRRGAESAEDAEKDCGGGLTGEVIGAAIAVHRALGPGLLESAYAICLAHELKLRGITVEREVRVPVVYRGVRLRSAYRIDLLVEGRLVVELKAVDALLPIHKAQLISYLRLTCCPLGLLINFNVETVARGLVRVANTKPSATPASSAPLR
jgi:GxxExxY protein